MEKNTQHQILGTLLVHDHGTVMEYLSNLHAEWFNKGFNRDVFDSITELNQTGKASNILTIITDFRTKGKLEKNYAGKISNLSAFAITDILSIHSLFSQLQYEFTKESVYNFCTSHANKIVNETFIWDQFIESFEKMKSGFDHAEHEEETNEETLNEIIQDHDKAKNGTFPGETIGMPGIEEKIILEPIDLMIIGARPGVGKTASAVTIACNKAFNENTCVSVFVLEMSKKQFVRRILAKVSGINSRKIRLGQCTESEIQQIRAIRNLPQFKKIHIHSGAHTIQEITRKIGYDKRNHDVKLCLLDYIQKITVKGNLNEFEKATRNSNDTKAMVQNTGIPTIAWAQLKRPKEGIIVRQPKLHDLRGTGDFEQDASIVAFLHVPWKYDKAKEKNLGEFCLAKNREDESEKVFNFTVDYTTSNWKEYEEPNESNPTNKDDDLPF
ncbi:MAG: replicative DNA helicase [Bacteroidia bacterium]|jgi:replicative DNA helicase